MPNRDASDCGRDNGYGRACDFEYAFTLMDVESGAKPRASGESDHLKSSLFFVSATECWFTRVITDNFVAPSGNQVPGLKRNDKVKNIQPENRESPRIVSLPASLHLEYRLRK